MHTIKKITTIFFVLMFCTTTLPMKKTKSRNDFHSIGNNGTPDNNVFIENTTNKNSEEIANQIKNILNNNLSVMLLITNIELTKKDLDQVNKRFQQTYTDLRQSKVIFWTSVFYANPNSKKKRDEINEEINEKKNFKLNQLEPEAIEEYIKKMKDYDNTDICATYLVQEITNW